MSDLEKQLEEVFMTDSRSRRVERVNILPARSGLLGNIAFVGAVAVVALAAIVAFNALRPPSNQVAGVPSASPTATATATPTPTATPTATPSASPSPTPVGLYVNQTYKFSLVLPPPYRQSTRAIIGVVTPPAEQFAFTARTEADEASIDTSGCHTACPLWQAAAYVIVSPGTGTQTPREYYAKEVGASTSEKIEDTTVEGRPAIKITTGAVYATAYVIKDGDRTFLIGYRLYGPENGMAIPTGASKEKLDAILASFKFLP
jgi:hypothetical protein